jgi:hypothetical protein
MTVDSLITLILDQCNDDLRREWENAFWSLSSVYDLNNNTPTGSGSLDSKRLFKFKAWAERLQKG